MSDIKLFTFGPDIVAAKNLRDAVRCYVSETGNLTQREALEEVSVMSKEDADKWIYHDDLDDVYRDENEKLAGYRSLSEQVKRHKQFPVLIATSEF